MIVSSYVVTKSVFGNISLHDLVTSCFILKPWLSSFGVISSPVLTGRGGGKYNTTFTSCQIVVNFVPWWTELRFPSPQSGESAGVADFQGLLLLFVYLLLICRCVCFDLLTRLSAPGFIAATTVLRDACRGMRDEEEDAEKWKRAADRDGWTGRISGIWRRWADEEATVACGWRLLLFIVFHLFLCLNVFFFASRCCWFPASTPSLPLCYWCG